MARVPSQAVTAEKDAALAEAKADKERTEAKMRELQAAWAQAQALLAPLMVNAKFDLSDT